MDYCILSSFLKENLMPISHFQISMLIASLKETGMKFQRNHNVKSLRKKKCLYLGTLIDFPAPF